MLHTAGFTSGDADFGPPVPVSREAIGRVRDLRRRIGAEDQAFVTAAARLTLSVRQRLKRHPTRNFRPETLAAIERSWHRDLPADYRISCRSELARDSLTITDTAVCAAVLEENSWGQDEPSLVISTGVLDLHRGHANFTSTITAVFSLHGLARRLQRSRATTDQELLDDVALLAGHSADEVAEDAGFAIHTAGGTWRGRCVMLQQRGRVLAVRTWLAA
jgi:hypothetical protein